MKQTWLCLDVMKSVRCFAGTLRRETGQLLCQQAGVDPHVCCRLGCGTLAACCFARLPACLTINFISV